MRLVNSTINRYLSVFLLVSIFQLNGFSQENSPYSRYGVGDISPTSNMTSRAMGGIAAGYSNPWIVNFTNPATYADLRLSTFDVGTEIDNKTLKSISPAQKFTSTNLMFSYVQLGLPIRMKKANKKDIYLGVNMGLKPLTRIGYKILASSRTAGDSLDTKYEGSGGVNQAFFGTGLRIRDFSVGFNTGFMFGIKNYSTQLSFVNDTVLYYKSSTAFKTNFDGAFFDLAFQYQHKFKDEKNKVKSILKIGAYGNMQQKLHASRTHSVQTIDIDVDGNKTRIDSVYQNNLKGTVILPSTFGIGFTYDDLGHWMFGADMEMSSWKNYRFYGAPDLLQNSWKAKAGAEFIPLVLNNRKYWNFVKYRFGFYYGKDPVKVTNNLPVYGLTFGAGLPLKIKNFSYETQNSFVNVAMEIAGRGNNKNSVKENNFKICLGFCMSDLWFRKVKYD